MRFSASSGRAWIGLGGLVGVAMGLGSARAQEAGCVDCLHQKHAPAVHGPARTPYMAPVVVEKRGGLLGRKRYSVAVFHQVAGQDPKPVNGPGAAPIGAPPSVVSAPPASSLAESPAPASYGPGPYGPALDSSSNPELMAEVGYGEPVPVGVMRTNYDQYQGGPAPAAPSALGGPGGSAPGRASTADPAVSAPPTPAFDPGIAMWHSVIKPGGSMVAGGDRKSFLDRMTDGENALTRWAEARQAKKMARFYRSSGLVPYNPGARSVPSSAISPPR